MNLSTVARYLFGNASAIREIAANRAALWTGILLVLLTAIARNYDQNYFLETPMWLFGPLVFSFFSGSFLYWILIRGFAKRHFLGTPDSHYSQWPTFMALFWITAPIAWLYAIPVERIFDSYRAAQANLSLLALVSLWRVLLMSRVISVLIKVHFLRALGWVLVAASLEVIVVVFFGGIFGPSFGQRVMAGMSGMRNAPEEGLLTSALGIVWGWSWAVLLVALALVFALRLYGATQPLPKSTPGKAPWLSLSVLAVAWITLAVPAQLEQGRFVTHARLVNQEQYLEALGYLSRFQKPDFPPGRRLEPNPYEYRVWQHLPPTVALLTTNVPAWIRHVYLSHATSTLTHYRAGYHSLTNVAAMFSAVEQLPEGRPWLLTNQIALSRHRLRGQISGDDSASAAALTNIVATLRRMGMAETNVASVAE